MDEQKRRNWRWVWGVLAVLAIVVATLLAVLPSGNQGPTLRGRPALEWLNALVETNELSLEALTVFQETGAEVVPFLTSQATGYSWLSERVGDAQEQFGGGSRMFRWIDGVTYRRLRMEHERRRASVMVLGQLGTDAESATPVLLEILNQDYVNGMHDTIRQSNAIVAMVHVAPTNNEGTRAVIKHLGSYSPIPGVAEAAYRSLENLGPESREVIPLLITSLRNRKQGRYLSATSRTAATAVPTTELDDLLGFLHSTNASVREGAAFRLHEMIRYSPKLIDDSTNRAAIAARLSDPDPNVRLLAAESLSMAPEPPLESMLPVIQQLCRDPDYAARLRAVELLRNLGRGQAGAQQLLKEISRNDPAPVVRFWATEATHE